MAGKAKATLRPGRRGEPEQTAAAILKAALHEFSAEGVAGARTDAIARAAGVNKALLYYYFKDKEALYGAVIDNVFSGLRERVLEVLSVDAPPQERLRAYAGAHFDFAAGSTDFARILQHELMRSGRTKSPHLKHIATSYFRPMYGKLSEVFREGIESGEFREVDVRGFVICMTGCIVHYFHSIPFAVSMGNSDPLSAENLAAQKATVLDFITHAVMKKKP